MSSPYKIEISKTVWQDKLDLLFSQTDDSLIINEAIDSTDGFLKTIRKTSKFLKFFKPEDNSENERASASTGENSSGDCEDDFRRRCSVKDFNVPQKVKISTFLRNGWDVAIKKQKSLNLRYILPHACAVSAGKRGNSKIPHLANSLMRTQIPLKQSFNGKCMY